VKIGYSRYGYAKYVSFVKNTLVSLDIVFPLNSHEQILFMLLFDSLDKLVVHIGAAKGPQFTWWLVFML